MTKTIHDAVREVCLSFPEAEEYVSHGSPNFRVRKGGTFATFVVNHHGDGRVALWLNAPAGAQAHYTGEEPKHFFVPPYVGPRGWLGVHLDKGLSWKRVASLVRQAYEKVAPPRLAAQVGKTIEIDPPKAKLSAAEFDPMQAPRAKQVLKSMREICLALPETTEDSQFGSPVWRAGRKVFAQAYAYDNRPRVAFWVGIDKQGFYTADKRFEIPPYMGHNGWIALDVTRTFKVPEVRALAHESYRHFALKRMLAKLQAC
jgi:predicted DNA-binding protein (MmcQ/YjbR family)